MFDSGLSRLGTVIESMRQNILRTIPSVNELLESPEISKLTDLYPRQLVVEAVREVLERHSAVHDN